MIQTDLHTDSPRTLVHGTPDWQPLVTAGIVLGTALGGFIDGILLHQILQLHNMLSNRMFPDTVVNVEINMFWDGMFHLLTWLTALFGISLLWKAMKRPRVPFSARALSWSMVLGWGLFNVVEGLIDHHILQLHHVVQRASPGGQLAADLVFLGASGFLVLAGVRGIKAAKRAWAPVTATSRMPSAA